MFSKINTGLGRSDNEFVNDFSTHENRQTKIQKLQSARLRYIISILLSGVLAVVLYFLQLLQIFLVRDAGDSGLVLFFTLMIFVVLIHVINFSSIDSQIKTLLLYDKTQTE